MPYNSGLDILCTCHATQLHAAGVLCMLGGSVVMYRNATMYCNICYHNKYIVADLEYLYILYCNVLQ